MHTLIAKLSSLSIITMSMLVLPGCLFDHAIGDKERDNRDCGVFSERDSNGLECDDGDRCPDGACPYRRSDLSEVDETGSKTITHQELTSLEFTSYVAPTNVSRVPSTSDLLNEVKTGAYHCMRCKEKTVGDGWHHVFTPSGDSALFLCERCWSSTQPAERLSYLDKYLQAHKQSTTPAAERLRSAIQ